MFPFKSVNTVCEFTLPPGCKLRFATAALCSPKCEPYEGFRNIMTKFFTAYKILTLIFT